MREVFRFRIFDKVYTLLAQLEGNYSNDPDDPGGETKFGLSRRAYPDLDFDSLTPDQAKAIYYRDYWCNPRLACDQLAVPGGVRLTAMVFDAAVHHGRHRAGLMLQYALKELGADIKADGWLGPKTLAEISRRRFDNAPLLGLLIVRRLELLVRLGQAHPKYSDGWILRVTRLLRGLVLLDFSSQGKVTQR